MKYPAEMVEYKHWVLWRRVDMNGRATKIPVSPWSGKAASCDKPETWSSFRHVHYALKRVRADGIGFVFTEADPFCGIDLDKCRASDRIEDSGFALIRKLDSYTELSPSGTGVHVIVRASIRAAGRRVPGIEIYDRGRYFTVTGKHLAGTPLIVEERQTVVDRLMTERFPSHLPELSNLAPNERNASDDELIRRALSAKSGARFLKLWSGDISDYEGDHSRADAALCRMLAFWTGEDLERVDRLFRASGLMREKWNRPTGQETYGTRTIRVASGSQQTRPGPEKLSSSKRRVS